MCNINYFPVSTKLPLKRLKKKSPACPYDRSKGWSSRKDFNFIHCFFHCGPTPTRGNLGFLSPSCRYDMRSELFKTTSRIASLARSGLISHARQLFDEMPRRDTIAWNSMISSYSQLGIFREALSLFHQMRASGTMPDQFTLTATLSASAAGCSLRSGTKIHALVVVSGYQSSLPVCNSLIDMYGKCLQPLCAAELFGEMEGVNEVTWCSLLFAYTNSGMFSAAKEVFDSMPRKVDVAWNTMIAGLGSCGEIESCLDMFREMRNGSTCEPDQWTYSALISACTEFSELVYGCVIHAIAIKSGWSDAVEVKNSILSFYGKIGSLSDAVKVFDSGGMVTQVSWNAAIDVYLRLGNTHEAFLAFQRMPEKNVVSWTSMIAGCARNGRGEEAISLFVGMTRNFLRVDDFTYGAIFHACSSLTILGVGRMVHGSVVRSGFSNYAFVANGLINMYAKCGDLEGSIRAFDDFSKKDLVSFNALLFGFGLHGKANQALKLYEDMIASGIAPDKVTFIGLLITCSHSGLFEKGRSFFETMRSVYGIAHDTDHVACMVDLLGRGGYLAEAKELVDKFSAKGWSVKASLHETLLGACSAHSEVGMGTNVGEVIKSSEPRKEMSYVLQSNLYCASGQWKEAETVRKAMMEEGIEKMPGCSWIDVSNKVTSFVAGDLSNPHRDELHDTLHCLRLEMINPYIILHWF